MSINRDLADSAAVPPFRKNIIINGDMRIWQRGTTFTATPTDFTADRFQWIQAGAGVVSVKRDPATPANLGRYGYALKVDVTTADASIAAGDVYGVRYPIEAQDIQHLNIGTTAAKTVTLSFRVASGKTGIHSGSLRNGGGNRSYVFEYTINAVNAWETKTITIDLDTTGTWLKDNNLGMDLFFSVATGTTFQGTVDAWTAGNFVGSASQVNVMDNVANNFWVANVQLEVGTEATDFEYRSITQELVLCQRYFEKSYNSDVVPGTATQVGIEYGRADNGVSTAISYQSLRFKVTKRDTPTISYYGHAGTLSRISDGTGVERSVTAGVGVNNIGASGFGQDYILGSAADGKRLFHWIADAEL